jgi:hypothetical protein
MRRPSALFLLPFTLILAACGRAGPDLSGTWTTDCLAQTNGGMTSYNTFEISDVGGTPRFTVTTYAESTCATKVFALANQSARTVGAEIPNVPGAYELTIDFKKLTAVAYLPMAGMTLSMSGCGTGPYTVGEEKDVSATGCFFFRPIADCAQDYDIVKVEGDKLFNGVRAGNQCVASGRPTALNTFSFNRKR